MNVSTTERLLARALPTTAPGETVTLQGWVHRRRELAKVTVNMVDAILSGKVPEVNDGKTYNNGVKVVPSYLLKPVTVDKSNWKEVLVTNSGYYTDAQIR